MKRVIACLIALSMLLALSASAASSLSGDMFYYAKGTLTCLAAGDYNKVVTAVPFSGMSPSAQEWQNFAEYAFSSLIGSRPQTKYAVGYWTGSIWKIAVPLRTPDSDGVETLVLTSEDGRTCSGYGSAHWGSVRSEYQNAAHVTWNEEYISSGSVIVEYD